MPAMAPPLSLLDGVVMSSEVVFVESIVDENSVVDTTAVVAVVAVVAVDAPVLVVDNAVVAVVGDDVAAVLVVAAPVVDGDADVDGGKTPVEEATAPVTVIVTGLGTFREFP